MGLTESFLYGNMSVEFDFPKELAILEIHGSTSINKILSMDEIKFWAEKFNQALAHFEKTPKVGSKVQIIKGMFSGFKGIVVDIDIWDKTRPLAVELEESELEKICFVDYVDYGDVKVVEPNDIA